MYEFFSKFFMNFVSSCAPYIKLLETLNNSKVMFSTSIEIKKEHIYTQIT
jgi:hypothetical protein